MRWSSWNSDVGRGSKLNLYFWSSRARCYVQVPSRSWSASIYGWVIVVCLLSVVSIWWWMEVLADLSASLCSVLLQQFQWPYERVCSQQRPCVADTTKMNVFFKGKNQHIAAERASADEVLWETSQMGSTSPKCTWAKSVAQHAPECWLWLIILYQKFHFKFFLGGGGTVAIQLQNKKMLLAQKSSCSTHLSELAKVPTCF